MANPQGGKKGRKHGRNKKKHSNQRYVAEMRWIKNAKRRSETHAKRVAKKAARLEARGIAGYSVGAALPRDRDIADRWDWKADGEAFGRTIYFASTGQQA